MGKGVVLFTERKELTALVHEKCPNVTWGNVRDFFCGRGVGVFSMDDFMLGVYRDYLIKWIPGYQHGKLLEEVRGFRLGRRMLPVYEFHLWYIEKKFKRVKKRLIKSGVIEPLKRHGGEVLYRAGAAGHALREQNHMLLISKKQARDYMMY